MNETSSKYVDSFATEKLINEKLSKVSHSPMDSLFKDDIISFEDMGNLSLDRSTVEEQVSKEGITVFSMPSYCSSGRYIENDRIYLYYYPAANPKYNILLLHGLFDDNMVNYIYFIRQLNNLNVNVFFMILPYHFERKPHHSSFSGEYFFSADIYRTCNAIVQTMYDIEVSYMFIKSFDPLETVLTGFSMGGCMAYKYFVLKGQTVKTFLFNPVTELSTLVLDNPLLTTIGKDIINSGFDMDEYTKMLQELDPCHSIDYQTDNNMIAVVYSIYDQIISEKKYKRFIEKTGINNVNVYSAGHLNVLRVPRLAVDIVDFLTKGI